MLAGGYAEIVQYQNASLDVALFDAVGGEEEAFVHSMRPFPFHLIPSYQPTMPWPSTRQKVDKDFILVCEFSEIIGPTSLITIPRDGGKNFDKDTFAVKIMAVDYNATNMLRCYASFTIVEDTSVIIEDKEENVYAYVHHFTLYDIDARGYVRPFCMAYVTPDKNKLFVYLEKLMAKFKAVSQLFRSGNQLLFKADLDRRLADLNYTKDSLQIPKTCITNGTASLSSCTGGNNANDDEKQETDGPSQSALEHSGSQDSLSKNIKDCEEMLQEIRNKMDHSSFISKCKKREASFHSRQCCEECCLQSSGYHSDSEVITESRSNLSRTFSKSLSSLCKTTSCHCTNRPYRPKMIKADACRRYDRNLRSLQKLCGSLGNEALSKLQKLYKIFCRDGVVLKLEDVESGLVVPSSSLLTIGRTVQINFLAHVQSDADSYCRFRENGESNGHSLMGTPISAVSFYSESSHQSFPLSYDAEFVPGSTAASLDSLYYDVEEGLDDIDSTKIQDDDDWLEISITSSRGDNKGSYDETSRSQSFDVVSASSFSDTEAENTPHFMSNGTVPLTNGYDKCLAMTHLSPPEPVVSRCSKVPVGCYASRLISNNTDLPGTGIKTFLHKYHFSVHLIYAVLSGRTVVLAAKPKHEKEVYSLIRTLQLFVPGHSSNQLIVPWHTKPLTMCDLGRMKLVGLAKTRSLQRAIPASVFRFSTVFDYDTSRLWTPSYKGNILLKTLSHCNHFRHDQTCIASIEAMMMKYSAKAYLFYHTYCLKSSLLGTQNDAASYFLSKIDVVEGDVDIVKYWVDIIKQQQISEYLSRSNYSSFLKAPIKLNYKASSLYVL